MITSLHVIAAAPRKPQLDFWIFRSLQEYFDMIETREHTYAGIVKAMDSCAGRIN